MSKHLVKITGSHSHEYVMRPGSADGIMDPLYTTAQEHAFGYARRDAAVRQAQIIAAREDNEGLRVTVETVA